MPKSTKHKAARKADFARAKLKLGKGKQIASNSTNTSISSKSIGLSNQSITQSKSGPTTPKNHTLEDLLIQSKHYSTSVKKDALVELQQLLMNYPFLLLQHLLPLFSTLSHLISDPASSIRNLSLTLMRYIFNTLSIDLLVGVSAGLILFTISALSSLDEGIRLSALKILDLLLEKVPREIVVGWNDSSFLINQADKHQDQSIGNQVVEALLGVLRVRKNGLAVGEGGFTSASNGSDLSPSIRSATLATLSSFLKIALTPNVKATSALPRYLASSFLTDRDYNTFLSLSTLPSAPIKVGSNIGTQLAISSPTRLISLDSENFALRDLSTALSFKSFEAAGTVTGLAINLSVQPTSLLCLLSPTLLSSFLDSAPSAFSSTTTFPMSPSIGHHLETVCAAMNIAQELYSYIFNSKENSTNDEVMGNGNIINDHRKTLLLFLKHVGTYFPFDEDRSVVRNADAVQALIQLNVTFSSLVSLLTLQGNSGVSSDDLFLPATPSSSSSRLRSFYNLASKVEQMISKVSDWIIPALKGEISSTSHPMGHMISAEAFESLEPTIWSLMNHISKESSTESAGSTSDQVVDAVMEYFLHAPSASETFIDGIGIQIKDYAGYANTEGAENISKMSVNDWILTLPKYLWELSHKSLETTKIVIRFLTQMLARNSLSLPVLAKLSSLLSPFFHLQHITRGSTLGPFVKLPLEIQIYSIDLVANLAFDNKEIMQQTINLREAVATATGQVGGEIGERWSRVLETKSRVLETKR